MFARRSRGLRSVPEPVVMTQAASRSPILIGASWYFLEKSARLLGSFLIGAWVARHLGPEGYGTLAYALALVAVLSFLGSLGIESLVVRDLVEAKRDPRHVVSTYFFTRLAGAFAVPVLAAAYVMLTHAHDRLLLVLAIICSGAVLMGAFDAADCWLQSRNQARSTSIIRLIGFVVGALSRCLFILSDASVNWFAIVVLIESIVVAALYWRILHRNNLAPSLRYVSRGELKHQVLAGKMMVLSGLTVAIYSKVDVLVVGALLSKEALGSYAIAASMCAAWNMVGMSLVQAWAPRISAAMVQGQSAYLSAMRQVLAVALAVSLGGSFLLCLASEMIFSLLLGPSYAAGADVFKVLVWSSVFVFLGVATSQIIVNERLYWVSFARTTTGLIACLVLMSFADANWKAVDFAFLMILTSALATSAIVFSTQARKTLQQVLRPAQIPT